MLTEQHKNTAVAEPLEPLIAHGHSITTVTEKITDVVLKKKTPKGWYLGFGIGFMLLNLLMAAITYLFAIGTGIWGINIPVGWGFAIINFVWWIGIGHAGTLISAILLLLRQKWRMSIARFAEAMTLFAVACALVFPGIHVGRPWLAYWLFPIPNTMSVWPQFRSPLLWDVVAVSTYGTVSLLFWYVGLIPDLATFRDCTKNAIGRRVYGFLALGWRGSAIHWNRYDMACLILAGLSTPLVLSVHTVVSFDFAVSLIPGWHTTIFPPYFVAGAIYSGFAMVLTLAIPIRHYYNLKDFVTDRHLDYISKVMLATGLIVAYGYLMEAFAANFESNKYEAYMMHNRMFGPYAMGYWALIACNIAIPQLLWFKGVRRCAPALFVLSLIINVGMWLERFEIVVTSLHRDFMPSAWGMYYPTKWDWATYAGTIGLFLTLFLLFIRALPLISMFEIRHLLHESEHEKSGAHSK